MRFYLKDQRRLLVGPGWREGGREELGEVWMAVLSAEETTVGTSSNRRTTHAAGAERVGRVAV